MLKQIGILLIEWLAACLVLAWEQTYSLPFLFLFISMASLRLQPKNYREVLFLLLGVSLASLYQMWLGVGVLFLFLLLAASYLIGRSIPDLKLRLGVTALVGSIFLAMSVGIPITPPKLLIVLISGGLVWVASRFIRWEVRSVRMSNASWGWQKS